MNRARKKLLARPAFPEQQGCGIGCGDALNLLADFPNGRVFADNAGKSVARRVLFAEQQIFTQEFLLTGGAVHQELQVFKFDRLLQKVEGAFDFLQKRSEEHTSELQSRQYLV